MNISTRAIRVPLTLLLVLSFLVQALPLHVFAQEAPSEPPAETPAPIEVPLEVAPETVADPVIPTEPVNEPVIPAEPEVDNSDIVEAPTAPIVEDVEAPVFRMEATDAPTYLSLSGTVDLPNGCITEDVSGQTFVFPTATTTQYLAVCALTEAVDEGVISDVELTSSSFGLYVSSINGIPAGTNEYWAIWINDGYADCGVSCQALTAGDEIAFVRTAYDPVTYAETQLDRVELTITSLEDTYDNIIVPDACAVTDASGVTHAYPQGDSLLGVCGLVAAASEGHISGYELTDSTFGLFVSSLDGIPAGTNEYWAIWMNDRYANCGVSCQTLSAGDEIAFVRTAYDPVTYAETQYERVELRVIGSAHVTLPTEDGGGTGGTGDNETTDTFSVSAAFSYLAAAQESDGSIENDLVTDWSAIAFAAGGAPSTAKTLLKEYLKNEEVDVDTASDYIRHAMAMLALDLNPYSAGPEDYITPIVESFDGTQLGEDQYINDDIFALFPLTHAGYSEDDQLIKDIVSFVLSQQQSDGSWVGGTDMTAAAIQALEPLSSLPGVPDALTRAEAHLKSKQESDGGFGDVFATTWVVLAINALGDDPVSWRVGDNNPLTYLAAAQEEDGSVSTSSGTSSDAAWATAYAIPAVKGTTWHELLDTVRKQEPVADSGDEEEESTTAPVGEVLGAEDAIVPEPLLPAFTFAAPSEEGTPSPEPREVLVVETASDMEEAPEEPSALVASVAEAEGSSWLMEAIGSFWQGIIDFFRGFFS